MSCTNLHLPILFDFVCKVLQEIIFMTTISRPPIMWLPWQQIQSRTINLANSLPVIDTVLNLTIIEKGAPC